MIALLLLLLLLMLLLLPGAIDCGYVSGGKPMTSFSSSAVGVVAEVGDAAGLFNEFAVVVLGEEGDGIMMNEFSVVVSVEVGVVDMASHVLLLLTVVAM
jgi:hypothetical protein